MLEWQRLFQTVNKGKSLPVINVIAVASRQHASYYWRGIDRQNDSYGVFKYTISGEGLFKYKGKEYRVREGDALLFKAADPEVEYGFPKHASKPWRFIYADIYGIDSLIDESVDRYGPVFKLPANSLALKALFQYQCSKLLISTMDYYKGARIVMNLFFEIGELSQQNEGTVNNFLLDSVEQILDQRIQTGVTVKDVAKALSVSREHLSRVFKKQAGVTLQTYINRKRMLCACNLLLETSLSCKEIAYRLGDPSPSHFNNMFKKYIGLPPKVFRDKGILPAFN